jgi:multisubunit Na+/H+ antiporter MnhE subunit
VFENGFLRDKVIENWRKLRNEELYVLYSSPNNILAIKSRIRLARHVARMKKKIYAGVFKVNLNVRDKFEDYVYIQA